MNLQGNWKNEADEYFSWALSVAALSKGHLLVDLIPEDNHLFSLTPEENRFLGIALEGAIRYCLDTSNVTRLVCSRHCTPENLYHAVARPMKKLMSSASTVMSKPDNSLSGEGLFHQQKNMRRRQYTSALAEHGARLKPLGRQTKTSKFDTEKLQRLHEERTRELEIKLPYVFIVQDMELLPRKTQMALLELMDTGVMPIKLVTMTNGSDPIAVPGVTQLPMRFMVVALTSSVPQHKLDFDSVYMKEAASAFGSSGAGSGSGSSGGGAGDAAVLHPALFDQFLLRVPLKLPPRKQLLEILRQKVMANASTLRLHSSGHFEVLGREEEETFFEDEEGENEWITASRFCLLWPSAAKLGKASKRLRKDDEKIHNPFARVTRIQKAEMETLSAQVLRIHMTLTMKQHLRDIVTALRSHSLVVSGPSTQTLNALERAVRAVAQSQNSTFVSPGHVLSVVIETLSHRIVLKGKPKTDQSRRSSFHGELSNSNSFYPPDHWHPVTAARLIVAQVYAHYVPVQRVSDMMWSQFAVLALVLSAAPWMDRYTHAHSNYSPLLLTPEEGRLVDDLMKSSVSGARDVHLIDVGRGTHEDGVWREGIEHYVSIPLCQLVFCRKAYIEIHVATPLCNRIAAGTLYIDTPNDVGKRQKMV